MMVVVKFKGNTHMQRQSGQNRWVNGINGLRKRRGREELTCDGVEHVTSIEEDAVETAYVDG